MPHVHHGKLFKLSGYQNTVPGSFALHQSDLEQELRTPWSHDGTICRRNRRIDRITHPALRA